MNKVSQLRNHIDTLAKQYDIFAKAFEYYNSSIPFDLKSKIARAEQVTQKAEQATWLYCLAATTPAQVRQLGFESKDEFNFVAIGQINLESLEKKWASWKCTSIKGLTKRLGYFHKAHVGKVSIDSAFATLISNKMNNTNALRLGFEQQVSILLIYRESKDPNYKKTFRLYLEKANSLVDMGYWKPEESFVTQSTVARFLKQPTIKRLLDPTVKLKLNAHFLS